MTQNQAEVKPPVLLLNEVGFEILRSAVRMARDGNINKIDVLREKLQERYPSEMDQIQLAISTWAQHVQENKSAED